MRLLKVYINKQKRKHKTPLDMVTRYYLLCLLLLCVYYYYFIFEANVSAILAFSFSLQFTSVLLYCYVHFAVTVS